MNYRLSTEADLTVSLTVYDHALGLIYDIDHEVYNVPVEGQETRTPATYFDPPETDGEAWVDLTPAQIIDLIEEQDDGQLREDGLELIETAQEIAQIVSDAANEWAAESDSWDVDDGYDG